VKKGVRNSPVWAETETFLFRPLDDEEEEEEEERLSGFLSSNAQEITQGESKERSGKLNERMLSIY
jgi:hypothetical protein